MDSCTIHHTPMGFCLETGTGSYLISDKDIPLLRRGQSVPLRDPAGQSLGPEGVVYTRKADVTIRIPGGETVAIPARLMNAGDNIRRVI